jgi:hypothetical protein
MRHFTIMQGYIVDSNEDGSVGINARIFAKCDEGDTDLKGAAMLCRQANAAALLLPIVAALVACPDYRGIGTHEMSAARDALERIRAAERPNAPKVSP